MLDVEISLYEKKSMKSIGCKCMCRFQTGHWTKCISKMNLLNLQFYFDAVRDYGSSVKMHFLPLWGYVRPVTKSVLCMLAKILTVSLRWHAMHMNRANKQLSVVFAKLCSMDQSLISITFTFYFPNCFNVALINFILR